MSSRPTVSILRHQHFLPSETFITRQASALKTFQPLFVARDPVPASPSVRSASIAQFGKSAVTTYALTRRSAALRQILAKNQTKLLHAHFGVEGVYAVPTARALGIPLVTTLHGFDVSVAKAQLVASRKTSWINYVAWRHSLFAEGAVFVCVSEHVRRKAIEWGYPRDRTVVLPIGIDVDVIQAAPVAESPTILHVARLVAKKGTADLLHAFATVKGAVADAELLIVGDGPLLKSLNALATELGVGSTVRFLGVQSHQETLRLLRGSRVLCVPSVTAPNGDQEGLPTVILEAAAAGKPVVATQHGGIPEAIIDGMNGFLVPEHDHAAIADRLTLLLNDPLLCDRFGKAGREMVVERFNLRHQTDLLESLYRSLL